MPGWVSHTLWDASIGITTGGPNATSSHLVWPLISFGALARPGGPSDPVRGWRPPLPPLLLFGSELPSDDEDGAKEEGADGAGIFSGGLHAPPPPAAPASIARGHSYDGL